MNRSEVFEKLDSIFSDVFDQDIHLKDDTNSDDIEEWDSLEQINLVVSIEEDFKIKFTVDEVSAMKNVGDMVDAILAKC